MQNKDVGKLGIDQFLKVIPPPFQIQAVPSYLPISSNQATHIRPILEYVEIFLPKGRERQVAIYSVSLFPR